MCVISRRSRPTSSLPPARHELRTPLAAVYGAAQTLLRHDFALDRGRARPLRRSSPTSRSASAASSTRSCSPTSSTPAASTSSSSCSTRRKRWSAWSSSTRVYAPPTVSVEFEAGDDLPRVAADLEQVRQVLVNLVENAIKYSPDGGHVEVGVEQRDDAVRFFVRDEGLGIPPQEQERVFRFIARPADDQRRRRHGPRALHLQGARRPDGGSDLGRVERGEGLDLLLRAPGRGRRSRTEPRIPGGYNPGNLHTGATWFRRGRFSGRAASPGPGPPRKQPGTNASAKDNSALALAA